MTDAVRQGRAGVYRRHVFPRIMDLAMNTAETRRIRGEVCAPLRGDVLEIGFGTGHNLPFLPEAVTRVLAVDPMQEGRRLAEGRLRESSVPVDPKVLGWTFQGTATVGPTS